MRRRTRTLVKTQAPEGDSRKVILEAALKEFAAHGRSGARVDRIARAARVNKAMLYYYFGSKDRLYVTVISEYLSALTTAMQRDAVTARSLDELLAVAAERHVQVRKNRPEMLRLMLRELADPNAERLDMMAQAVIQSGITTQIGALLREGMAGKRIRKLDIHQVMASFFCMSMGYFLVEPLLTRVYGITDRDRFVAQRKKAIVDILRHGMEAK